MRRGRSRGSDAGRFRSRGARARCPHFARRSLGRTRGALQQRVLPARQRLDDLLHHRQLARVRLVREVDVVRHPADDERVARHRMDLCVMRDANADARRRSTRREGPPEERDLETRSRRQRRGRAVDGRDPRSAPTPLAPRNAPRAVRSGGSAAGASEERASRVARRVEFRLQRASRCEFAHQSTARVRRRPRARCRARARPRDRRAARATPTRPPPRRRTRRRTRSPRDASSARPARASSCTRTFEG